MEVDCHKEIARYTSMMQLYGVWLGQEDLVKFCNAQAAMDLYEVLKKCTDSVIT